MQYPRGLHFLPACTCERDQKKKKKKEKKKKKKWGRVSDVRAGVIETIHFNNASCQNERWILQ